MAKLTPYVVRGRPDRGRQCFDLSAWLSFWAMDDFLYTFCPYETLPGRLLNRSTICTFSNRDPDILCVDLALARPQPIGGHQSHILSCHWMRHPVYACGAAPIVAGNVRTSAGFLIWLGARLYIRLPAMPPCRVDCGEFNTSDTHLNSDPDVLCVD